MIVKELKRRFAAIVTNGQGEMKGKIFRIAHIGLFDYMDTIAIIGALEQVAAASLSCQALRSARRSLLRSRSTPSGAGAARTPAKASEPEMAHA